MNERDDLERLGSPEALWNAAQTATYLNTTKPAVYELARTGRLPAVHLGLRRVRFLPAEVKAWAERGGSR
jgi:excisionase family DNA binding protein